MIRRFLGAVALVTVVLGTASPDAVAQGGSGPVFTDLYAFGDSLTDTGNLFFLSGGIEPPSPPYFNGRFSNGPVWIESLAPMLGLTVDFTTPFARNQAIGGAFTDTRGEAGEGTGVLSQIDNFLAAGRTIGPDDLVVVWAGANNYFGGDAGPGRVVGDLAEAITELHLEAGAEHFLVPNLPNLGDTPGGQASGFGDALNLRTALHNRLLVNAMRQLRRVLDIDIVIVDVNAAFQAILANPADFGFDNVTVPCLIQQPDGSRVPTGACPLDGDTFDATGVLFWDLIHPTTAAHALVALVAYTTFSTAEALAVADDD